MSGDQVTYREIARVLGVSHENVRLIEQRALYKMARALRIPIAECAPWLRRMGERRRMR